MGKQQKEPTNQNEEIQEKTFEDPEKLEDLEFEGIDEEHIVSLEGIVEELQSSNKKLSEENQKLSEENQKFENEVNALKDKVLRLNAEYDNFRKRTAKEKEGIYTDACTDVLKNIFPILDNLERAASVEGSVEDIKKGIEMTLRQFKDSLEKLNIEEILTDAEFNPNFHNAVMHISDEAYGENQIVEVFQKGYKRGDKVLRYSMVKVAN